MKLINLETSSWPIVIHNNGSSKCPLWSTILNNFPSSCQSIPPEELTIITWNNSEQKGILERSLDHHGAKYIVLGRGRPWKRKNKISLNAEVLKDVDTKYTMGVDCYDVIVLNFRGMISKFLNMKCQMVFGAEINDYPKVPDLKKFDLSIAESRFCHLNSGCWIGKTKYCLEFFKECLTTDSSDILAADPRKHILNDDQGITRKVFQNRFPDTKLDYNCDIFQCLYGLGKEVAVGKLML